jgi:hypothetical protein
VWLAGTVVLVALGWLVREHDRTVAIAAALVLVPFSFLTAGMVAWRRRPDRRLGILLMLVAAPYLLAIPRFAIVEISIVGAFFLPGSDVLQAYILLAFPNDRIVGRLERRGMALLAAAFGLYVVLTAITLEPEVQVPAACPPCGPNPFRLIDNLDVGAAVQTAFGGFQLVAVALVVGLIIRRWVVATGPARRVLAPVLFGGVVFAFGIAARQVIGRLGDNELIPVLDVGSAAVRALVPIGLVATFLRLQSARDAASPFLKPCLCNPAATNLIAPINCL